MSKKRKREKESSKAEKIKHWLIVVFIIAVFIGLAALKNYEWLKKQDGKSFGVPERTY